jgi:hypothetical protein
MFSKTKKGVNVSLSDVYTFNFWGNSTGDGNRTRTNLRSQDFRTTIAFATTAELQFWGLDFLFTIL